MKFTPNVCFPNLKKTILPQKKMLLVGPLLEIILLIIDKNVSYSFSPVI